MVTIEQLQQVFAEKLLATGSFDAAFMKAVWIAYKQGISDAPPDDIEVNKSKVETDADQGWIPHEYGRRPVPGETMVEVKQTNHRWFPFGVIRKNIGKASSFDWGRIPYSLTTVVAYRVVKS